MPYNGAGTYAAPASTWNPAVTNTAINSTDWIALLADVTTALSTCMLKDGQQTPTANIAMGGFKFTGLAAGSATGNSLRYEQLFSSQALTDQATITWDVSAGAFATVTLAGSRTMAAPTNMKANGVYSLLVTQDGTGGRTLTWNAVFKAQGGGTMPQPETTAAAVTLFVFTSDGTNLYVAQQTPFIDSNYIVRGSSDATKKVRVEADGLTTATTRVATMPDADIKLSGHATGFTSGRIPFATGATGGVLTDSANLTFDGTTLTASAITVTKPTAQTFASASGTYTLPANCKWIKVTMFGGGGGGGGGFTGGGTGGTGGSTTFGGLTAAGGVGGSSGGLGGAGGTISGSLTGQVYAFGVSGSMGATGFGNAAPGGSGGTTMMGGAGSGGTAAGGNGQAAAGSTGAGGGGGGSNAAQNTGSGGGSGGLMIIVATSPSATYSYAVGAGGTAGTGTSTGGTGGSGYIIVDEYYV